MVSTVAGRPESPRYCTVIGLGMDPFSVKFVCLPHTCGFPPGAPVSSNSPKRCMLGYRILRHAVLLCSSSFVATVWSHSSQIN